MSRPRRLPGLCDLGWASVKSREPSRSHSRTSCDAAPFGDPADSGSPVALRPRLATGVLFRGVEERHPPALGHRPCSRRLWGSPPRRGMGRRSPPQSQVAGSSVRRAAEVECGRVGSWADRGRVRGPGRGQASQERPSVEDHLAADKPFGKSALGPAFDTPQAGQAGEGLGIEPVSALAGLGIPRSGVGPCPRTAQAGSST